MGPRTVQDPEMRSKLYRCVKLWEPFLRSLNVTFSNFFMLCIIIDPKKSIYLVGAVFQSMYKCKKQLFWPLKLHFQSEKQNWFGL